ncbi:CbiQ family ECF transporter T component [Allorhizobium undicola]|uniref:CbiQ family ECF transporter T component n=1 Tax=Allorhizobium undicola TaxID=78527 RepID=UPI003D34CF6D
MISLYVAGNGPLHRLPAAFKLLSLAVLAGVVLSLPGVGLLALAAALALGLYICAARPVLRALIALRPLAFSIALIAGFTALLAGPSDGLLALLRLSALALLAAAVTASTTLEEFMAVIERAARPLEKLGLAHAADLSLAVGLALRFLPDVLTRYRAIAEAHQARGQKLKPVTLIGPLMISVLREADAIASAIDARGIRGHEKAKPSRSARGGENHADP